MTTLKNLKAELDSGKLKNLYLFFGEEEYLIKHYIAQIKSKIITNDSLEDLNFNVFDEFTEQNFEDSISTLPVFAERKLIIFNQTGIFASPGANKDYLLANLSEISDSATVIFREKEIDKKQKKLLSTAEALGDVVEFNHLEDAQLKQWVNLLISKKGKKITVSNIDFLISCTGNSMETIENEVNKLCNFSSSDVISQEEIDSIVTKCVENRIFELSKAIQAKDATKVSFIINELKTLREEPVAITALIGKNFTDMYRVKTASPQNRTPAKLGMKEYPIKLHSGTKISRPRLTGIIHILLDCDKALKSSAYRNDWVSLEQYLLKATLE